MPEMAMPDMAKFATQIVAGDLSILDTLPLATHADAVKILAASLTERTKDLVERRTTEGRDLSPAHRQQLGESQFALAASSDRIGELLRDKQPVKADALRLRLRLLELSKVN